MINYESMKKTWASNFRNLISERGCTQKEVAEVLGVAQSKVSLWAHGKQVPNTEWMVNIADLFNTSVSEMLGEVPADHYENSRMIPVVAKPTDTEPAIDFKELDSMQYLFDKQVIAETQYYKYLADTLRKVANR